MLITVVSMKVMLDHYGRVANPYKAHSGFCVGDAISK
jgi:hypothetical protein